MDTATKHMEVPPEDRDLVSQLATLQTMHDQVLDLRTLLPQRLWNPILATIRAPAGSQPACSPSALFAHLRKTADDGCREIETFKSAWHSAEMQELWGKTKAEVFPQGTDTWTVNYRVSADELRKQEKGLLSVAETSSTIEEEPKDVIDKFKTRCPGFTIELADPDTLWPLTATVAGMSFEIERQEAGDAQIYQVGAKARKDVSNVQREIVQMVQERKRQDSLAYLLDMLASYDSIRTRACDKCLKIIDDNLQFAVVRESKPNEDSTDGAEMLWLAYHRKCA